MPQEISLLNTSIGPVMRGPSSSHSAAPYMIGRTARELALNRGDVVSAVKIFFDPDGSFAQVYANQGSDEGFAAGVEGVDLMSDEYHEALNLQGHEGRASFAIEIAKLAENDHPNRADIHLTIATVDGSQRVDRLEAVSLGGGVFNITRLNDSSIFVDGKCAVILIEHEGVEDAAIHSIIADLDIEILAAKCGSRLNQYDLASPITDQNFAALAVHPSIKRVRYTAPRQYAALNGQVLYSSVAKIMQDRTKENDLSALAVQYEAQRLQVPTEQVRSYFRIRLQTMLDSVERGFAAEAMNRSMKFLQPSARNFHDSALPPEMQGSFLKNAIAAALAVMEQTSCRGVVCAAPTAGSAGIVPGSLYALRQAGANDAQLVAALQVMALVGAVFAARGSFAAETGGCSVETGASSAMAAGGLVHFYGGAADQVFEAAALCLMNTLGLVCDPVGGEVEIPCHARNIAGVSHAWSATMAVLGGFKAVLPFDELVDMTVTIGAKMDSDLRCTARGGCAKTPTAHKLTRTKSPIGGDREPSSGRLAKPTSPVRDQPGSPR